MDPTSNPTPNGKATPNPNAPTGFVGADGALAEGWLNHEKIPADLRANKTLATIKDVPSLAAQVVNLEKVLGSKRAVIPTGPEDKTNLDTYYRYVGWPETPEGYPDVKAAELPQGMAADPELTKSWRQWCHEARLTPSQMEFLTRKTIEWNINSHNLSADDRAKALREAKTNLQSKWQAKYNLNVQLAETAAAAFADEAELAHAKEAGWLEDPVFLSIMHKVGGAVSPDRLNARSDGGIAKGSIQRRIDDLMHSDAYLKETGARHDRIVEEIMQLRNQLHAAG